MIEVFKYAGGERDLIDPVVAERLENVAPLRRGQQVAEASGRVPPESQKTPLVPLENIKAVCRELSPTCRAMVSLMVSTGMRPCEVFNLTPGEVDRSTNVWVYRPSEHKTSHLGVEKQWCQIKS
jgi:integrase